VDKGTYLNARDPGSLEQLEYLVLLLQAENAGFHLKSISESFVFDKHFRAWCIQTHLSFLLKYPLQAVGVAAGGAGERPIR
jgi:hypothetical protein